VTEEIRCLHHLQWHTNCQKGHCRWRSVQMWKTKLSWYKINVGIL